ncbi:glycoside hydrolase family 19 protein [Novosphingobium piscinae]|uniref:Glycoside hydrolase family 19 protein n=2 Tax=Novosphingobium piscinae TaxID=1507448 RepID=A0A7X1FXE3_9SPHN|nr:glycoside hydrolase family 19 protein [Novosphingobium piscinae]
MAALLPFGEAASLHLPQSGIDQTAARICNFVGQAAHECNRFRNMREIWGPTPAQVRYEGRADLGNTRPGDGRRYLGRGIFQLTGRANYRQIGNAIGIDLESNPELAETPDVAVQTAAFFWRTRNLNLVADKGEEDRITRLINGGTNGIADRRQLVARAKGLFL